MLKTAQSSVETSMLCSMPVSCSASILQYRYHSTQLEITIFILPNTQQYLDHWNIIKNGRRSNSVQRGHFFLHIIFDDFFLLVKIPSENLPVTWPRLLCELLARGGGRREDGTPRADEPVQWRHLLGVGCTPRSRRPHLGNEKFAKL